jgi:hypothetical protein
VTKIQVTRRAIEEDAEKEIPLSDSNRGFTLTEIMIYISQLRNYIIDPEEVYQLTMDDISHIRQEINEWENAVIFINKLKITNQNS